jgi:hypothetical protein
MSDQDLSEDIDDLIHTKEEGGVLQFFAPKLHWHESEDNFASIGATNYCPAVEWIKISSKPADSPKEEIAAERKRILGIKKYFRICKKCQDVDSVDRFNTSKNTCDACAERYDGVCF